MTTSSLAYSEEVFGILTDDDLYLDCILVRPPEVADEALRAIRVWVPKFPLTKSSVLTCARQEVQHHGERRKIAHLVFDLRGTGDSEGVMGDRDFDVDLHAVREWAQERFPEASAGFLGTPLSEYGRVNMWPLRSGSVMESYYYPAVTGDLSPPTLLYLSTYGSFSRSDDLVCTRLAQSGYDVFGTDPLRYLLHASVRHRLKPEDLREDMQILIQMLPKPPIIIAQPMAAGLGMLWTSLVQQIQGIIAIGRAQVAFTPAHVFQNSNPYTFLLSRYVHDIAPRPLALVKHDGHSLGGDEREMNVLFDSSREPHRLDQIDRLSFKFLKNLLEWVQDSTL